MEGINGKFKGNQRIGGQFRGAMDGACPIEGATFKPKLFTYAFGSRGTGGSSSLGNVSNPSFVANSATDWSVCVWIWLENTNVGADGYGLLFANGGSNGLYFRKLSTTLFINMFTSSDHNTTNIINTGVWTHYAGVNIGGKSFTHYLNGIPAGTFAGGSTIQTSPTVIFFTDAANEFWNGLMCEFYAFSGRALTSVEVQQMARAKYIGEGMRIAPTALQLNGFYLPFNDVAPGQQLREANTYSSMITPFTSTADGTSRIFTNGSSTSGNMGFDIIKLGKGFPWENGQV